MEAPAHALEAFQRTRDRERLDAEMPADGGGGQRVEHVVPAGQIERDRQRGLVRQHQVEMHARSHLARRFSAAHVGAAASMA